MLDRLLTEAHGLQRMCHGDRLDVAITPRSTRPARRARDEARAGRKVVARFRASRATSSAVSDRWRNLTCLGQTAAHADGDAAGARPRGPRQARRAGAAARVVIDDAEDSHAG
ncbi:MAG TPA: hypothetical protein VNI83_10485, partial [Vicinamibacterales bacterium]|nr:hypothetical protein [Vicinamibacterales bacterium]